MKMLFQKELNNIIQLMKDKTFLFNEYDHKTIIHKLLYVMVVDFKTLSNNLNTTKFWRTEIW